MNMSPVTSGPVVDEMLATDVPGISPAEMYFMSMISWILCQKKPEWQENAAVYVQDNGKLSVSITTPINIEVKGEPLSSEARIF